MTTFPSHAIRHTRLPHTCADCAAPIPVGTPATMCTGLDGVFWRVWQCPACAFDEAFEIWQDAQAEKHLLGRL